MKKALFSILLIIMASPLFGQDAYLKKMGIEENKKYSLSDTVVLSKIIKTARDSAFTNAELTKEYARLVIDISKQIEYPNGQIDGLHTLSIANVYLNQVDEALKHAKLSLSLSKKAKNNERIMRSYEAIGNVSFFQERFDLAANAYLEAIKIGEKINSNSVTRSYGNLGLVFMKSGNIPKATEYFDRTYAKGKELNDAALMTFALNNLGLIEKNRGNYDEAFEYFDEGIRLARKESNLDYRLSELLHNMSMIYFFRGDYENGMKIFEESLDISKDNSSYHSLAISYLSLGINLFEIGRIDEGLEASEKALEYGELSGSNEIQMEAYKQLAQLYSKTGDHEQAYACMTLAFVFSDSLKLADINNAIASAENVYEQEKKDLQYEMERKQSKKINDEKLRTRELMLWFSGGGFLVVIFGIFYLFRTNRKINSKNKLVERQKAEIEVQHKEITDSINYAQRIQNAIIAKEEFWSGLSKDHFVMFKPKDVVSGDFHWVYNDSDRKLSVWAVADCTGHGVPGAFMSMLGIGFLNEIIIDDKLRDPAQILNELRRKILAALDSESRDGMDIALCVLDWNTNELYFSGANNGLWLIRNKNNLNGAEFKNVLALDDSELVLGELGGDKMPIGKTFGNPPSFVTKKIHLKDEDVIVLCTDGFADQFGGSDNKKYKYRQLKELLLSFQDKPIGEQQNLLEAEFDEWKGNNEQTDDVCVVSVKFNLS